MTDLNNEIDRITSRRLPERHTYFQLIHFLIGKEPTVQAKMWRCIRELKARQETLEALKLEIDDVNDDMTLINMEIEAAPTETLAQQIKKRKAERRKTALDSRHLTLVNRLYSVEEECVCLINAFRSLEKIEPLKDHDDPDAQKAYWNDKLTQEFNLRQLFHMPVDLELVKTILALNSDSPIKQETLRMIENTYQQSERKNQNRELDALLEKTKFVESSSSEAPKELNGI